MSIISKIIGCILSVVSFGLLLLPIWIIIKEDSGWRRMEQDRKEKGLPFYGKMEEETEKDFWDIY